jgi:hypothetical protein
MWPRVVEWMLGFWLLLSPLIFHETQKVEMFAPKATVAGGVVALISLASLWSPLRKLHLANGAIAAWLILSGYFGAERPGPPAAQNDIVVGLLLLMFFVIPTEGHLPSDQWIRARTNQGR